ncbi:MAG: hypothetical protein ABL931_12935 [Usitatibacteraceae bacterium]
MRFADLQLKKKLMLIVASAIGIGLVLSLVLNAVYEIRHQREVTRARLVSVAQVIAANFWRCKSGVGYAGESSHATRNPRRIDHFDRA